MDDLPVSVHCVHAALLASSRKVLSLLPCARKQTAATLLLPTPSYPPRHSCLRDLCCIVCIAVQGFTSAGNLSKHLNRSHCLCQNLHMASGLLGQLRCLPSKPALCSLKARQPLPARRQNICAAAPNDDDFESTSEDVRSLPVAEGSGRVSEQGNRTEALIKSLQGKCPACSERAVCTL